MGNCSTTPHKNLYLRSYTANNGGISKTAESPDLKDKDGMTTTTKKKLWLSPYLEEEIGSDTSSGGGGELSPIILTPPMRSRMISAEIFESTMPPQSEERTVVADIDTDVVVSSRPSIEVVDEKVSPVSSEVVKSAYTSTVEPGSKNVTHLSESSLITLINIESKITNEIPPQKSDRTSFESATGPHIVQVATKNTQNTPEEVEGPKIHQANEVRVENQNCQVVTREHQHLARIALVVLLCFYLLSLACLGWTGMKAINSAKVLLLPPPKTIAHSFGKFV